MKRKKQHFNNIPPLSQIYFYLTEGCNLACRHCWLSPKYIVNENKYASLPLNLFEKAIFEAIPLGLTRVKLTGGEPLLHPDFLSMIQICKTNNIGITVETNGILCSKSISDVIKTANNPFVSISLDAADAKTHDRIRGVPGSFDLTIKGINNLVKSGIAPQIIMTLMRSNISSIEKLIHISEQIGASSVKFNLLQPIKRGEILHKRGEALTVQELLELGKQIDTKIAPNSNIDFFFDYPHVFKPLSRLFSERNSCGILNIIGVLSTGHYSLCGIGMNVEDLIFGKISEDPLDDLWRNNNFINDIRSGLPNKLEGICSKCLVKSLCLGSCLANNYYRNNSFWSPFWFCENAWNLGLIPNTRLT